MKIKSINPITSGTRHQIKLQKNLLAKQNKIVKVLFKRYHLKKGRSTITGHITVRHKGSGTKHKLHTLNSLNNYVGINICNMYSASHNTFISLNFDFKTKSFFKTRLTKNIYPGSLIFSNSFINKYHIGYRSKLNSLPVGSIVHSISNNNNILYSVSAGSFCQLLEKKKKCKIRLPSGKVISISKNYYGTLGVISNSLHKTLVIGKAGRNRLKGIRPSVRGIAMNPVDHPHGGRTNGGCVPVTPWGIPTKGKLTKKK